jgi:hypothetical protein
MPLGEAWRLTQQLQLDPTSAIGAAIAGWSYPISFEALVLADLFDLEHTVNTKKRPDPHPIRPFNQETRKRHIGNVAGRSREQVVAILDAARAGRAG